MCYQILNFCLLRASFLQKQGTHSHLLKYETGKKNTYSNYWININCDNLSEETRDGRNGDLAKCRILDNDRPSADLRDLHFAGDCLQVLFHCSAWGIARLNLISFICVSQHSIFFHSYVRLCY